MGDQLSDPHCRRIEWYLIAAGTSVDLYKALFVHRSGMCVKDLFHVHLDTTTEDMGQRFVLSGVRRWLPHTACPSRATLVPPIGLAVNHTSEVLEWMKTVAYCRMGR